MRFSGIKALLVTCAVITLFMAWFVVVTPSPAAASPVLLSAGDEKIPLDGHLEVLVDESGNLGISDITSPAWRTRFRELPGFLSAGYIPDGAVWLRFTIQLLPEAPSLWILEAGPAINEHLTLFIPAATGGFDSYRGGTLQSFLKRDMRYRLDLFRLNLPAASTTTLYLKIASHRAIISRPVIWRRDAHRIKTQTEALFHGAYMGIILLIAFFSLMYWIWLKKPLYGIYVLYILSIGFYFLNMYGYAHEFFWPERTWVIARATRINYLLLMLMNVGLFSEMLKLRDYLPRFDRACRIAGTAFFVCGVILTIFGWHNRIIIPIQLALLVSISAGVIVSCLLIRKSPGARLYLTAFSILLLTGAGKILSGLGILPDYPLSDQILLLASFVHIVVLKVIILREIVVIKREKYAVEALLAAEQRTVTNQRQFLRLISHEMRTPLAVIDSTAQIIPLFSGNREEILRNTGAILSATHQLSDLISSYLTSERLESGGSLPETGPVDVCRLMRDLVFHVQQTTDRHRITCEVNEPSLLVSCDPLLIEMLVKLLLENAIKYSPDGGIIALCVSSPDQGNVSITISDPGVGMTPDQISRVFEPFYRTDAVPGVSGVGLGLHLARHIAELHGGSVSCKSVPAVGSTFTVHLPLHRSAE